MPRSKNKIKRPNPDKTSMEEAVKEVLALKTPVRTVAEKYAVSKSSLARHVMKAKTNQVETFIYSPHYDIHKVFTSEEEKLLENYLSQCAILHYGLTTEATRKLAFQFAKAKDIEFPQTWLRDQAAGKGWLRCFRERHPSLSLRKPEPTSLARATSFNPENVKKFFDVFKKVLSRKNFSPSKIYNVDETGISTVQVPPKILAPKGLKQIGGMTSGERGVNVTMIACINAIDNAVPPLFVFPRVNFVEPMLVGAPPESIGAANPSGWSNKAIFLKYMNHFIDHVKPTVDDPVILLMDNHESHMSPATISRAKEAGVILVTFQPHTTHKMQPLDRTVFGPFKTYYNRSASDWMLSPGNAGKTIKIYDICSIAGKAYQQAFTPSNIISGFKVTGIYPLNTDIFTDDEYLPSNVTDRPNPVTHQTQIETPTALDLDATPSTSSARSLHDLNENLPVAAPATPQKNLSDLNEIEKSKITPEFIRPFPKAGPRKTIVNRRTGKARILTDTPEKEEIEERKRKTPQAKTQTSVKKKRQNITRRIFDEDSSDDDFDINDSSSSNAEDEVLAIDLERDLEDTSVKENDFVLINLTTKKTSKHFVAIVKKELSESELEIQYLKKMRTEDSVFFILNTEDQVFAAPLKEVVLKLPKPTLLSESSSRNLKRYSFPVSFFGYCLG